MYRVAVRRDFIALHYLTGGDFGAESRLHAHHYLMELILEGERLDGFGYLADIAELNDLLHGFLERLANATLNELPEFRGLNPSLEHFARIAAHSLSDGISAPNVTGLTLVLWEDGSAWASFRLTR
jgi:6-pyruvoyltetrahydropterin/6-carboxytetrahydropterin synthase